MLMARDLHVLTKTQPFCSHERQKTENRKQKTESAQQPAPPKKRRKKRNYFSCNRRGVCDALWNPSRHQSLGGTIIAHRPLVQSLAYTPTVALQRGRANTLCARCGVQPTPTSHSSNHQRVHCGQALSLDSVCTVWSADELRDEERAVGARYGLDWHACGFHDL